MLLHQLQGPQAGQTELLKERVQSSQIIESHRDGILMRAYDIDSWQGFKQRPEGRSEPLGEQCWERTWVTRQSG